MRRAPGGGYTSAHLDSGEKPPLEREAPSPGSQSTAPVMFLTCRNWGLDKGGREGNTGGDQAEKSSQLGRRKLGGF